MIKLLTTLLAGALLASPASAATFVNSTAGPDTAPAGLLTIDFNGATTLDDIPGLSGNGHIVQGFLSGVYAQPYLDFTKYLSVPQSGGGGTVTLDLRDYNFGGTVNGFSFYWGSIDTYNSIKINTSLGTTNFSFDGSSPPPPANGDQLATSNNRRAFFSLETGETLNSLEFVSNGYAMEIDDLVFTGVSAVPEPATWAIMILGFGFIGGAMRSGRRRKQAASFA